MLQSEINTKKKAFEELKAKKQKNTAFLVEYETKRNQDLENTNFEEKRAKEQKNLNIRKQYKEALDKTKKRLEKDLSILNRDHDKGKPNQWFRRPNYLPKNT